MNAPENQIIRLTLLAKLDFLPGATALVREITNKLGLNDKDARRLELVVEEACVNVIEHAFEGEIGSYDIVVERRPGQIIAAVEDRGAVGRVEVGRLHDRIGVREQVGRNVEVTAVHLGPRRRQAMPEGERGVAAHLGPQLVELFERGGVVVLGGERLGVGQPLLDVVAEGDRERRRSR